MYCHASFGSRVRPCCMNWHTYQQCCWLRLWTNTPQLVSVTEKQCVSSCCLFIPETVRQLRSWVSWMIVAQVQLSQMGGVGSQSWGQSSTAFLCDHTAWQPVHTHTHTPTHTHKHTHTHTHLRIIHFGKNKTMSSKRLQRPKDPGHVTLVNSLNVKMLTRVTLIEVSNLPKNNITIYLILIKSKIQPEVKFFISLMIVLVWHKLFIQHGTC